MSEQFSFDFQHAEKPKTFDSFLEELQASGDRIEIGEFSRLFLKYLEFFPAKNERDKNCRREEFKEHLIEFNEVTPLNIDSYLLIPDEGWQSLTGQINETLDVQPEIDAAPKKAVNKASTNLDVKPSTRSKRLNFASLEKGLNDNDKT